MINIFFKCILRSVLPHSVLFDWFSKIGLVSKGILLGSKLIRAVDPSTIKLANMIPYILKIKEN